MARLVGDRITPGQARRARKKAGPVPRQRRIDTTSPGLPGMERVSAPTRRASARNRGAQLAAPHREGVGGRLGITGVPGNRGVPMHVEHVLSRATVKGGRIMLKNKRDLAALQAFERNVAEAQHRANVIARHRAWESGPNGEYGVQPTGDLTTAALLLTPGGLPRVLGGTGLKLLGARLAQQGGRRLAASFARDAARLRVGVTGAREAASVIRATRGARLLRPTAYRISPATAARAGLRAAGATVSGSVRYGAAAALAPEAAPGGSFKAALEGQGRLASITPKSVSHGPLGVVANALKDVVNLPANALPMIYLPAAAIAHYQATGDSAPLNQLWEQFLKHDALGSLASGDFAGFLRNVQAHPVYAAAELGGAYAVTGRGLGAGIRAVHPQAARIGLGSRQSIDLGTDLRGLPEHEYLRALSPNKITAVMQGIRDRAVAPERQRHLVVGPQKRGRLQKRLIDESFATEASLTQKAQDGLEAIANKADLGSVTPALRAVIEGTINLRPEFLGPTLDREIARLEARRITLSKANDARGLEINAENLAALRAVKADPARLVPKLAAARDSYVAMLDRLEADSIAAGYGNARQFFRAKAKSALIASDPERFTVNTDTRLGDLGLVERVAPRRGNVPLPLSSKAASAAGVRYQLRRNAGMVKGDEGITWRPGVYQRGVINERGEILTWDPDRAIHQDGIAALNHVSDRTRPEVLDNRVDLDIEPNGNVHARLYGEDTPAQRQAIIDIVRENRPRLSPLHVETFDGPMGSNPARGPIHVQARGHFEDPAFALPFEEKGDLSTAAAEASKAEHASKLINPPEAVLKAIDDHVANLPEHADGRTPAEELGVPPLRPAAVFKLLSDERIREELSALGLRPEDLGYISQKHFQPFGLDRRSSVQPNALVKAQRTGRTTLDGTAPSDLRDIFDTPRRRMRSLARYGTLSRLVRTLGGTERFKTLEEAQKQLTRGDKRQPVNVEAFERREVMQEALAHNPDAWDPDVIDYLEEGGPAVLDEATKTEKPGTWILMEKTHIDRIRKHTEQPVLFEGRLGKLTSAWKRVILTTTPNWYMGNATQTSIAALMNRLVPPPFAAVAERAGLGAAGTGRRLLAMGEDAQRARMVPGGIGETSMRHRSRLTELSAAQRRDMGGFFNELSRWSRRQNGSPRAALKLWDAFSKSALTVNAKLIEEPLFVQMFGREAQRTIRASQPIWKRRFKLTENALKDFMEGKHGSAAQLALADRLMQETGNWHILSPWEKEVKRFVPFYMWHRAALRFVFLTVPHNHPVFTGLLAAAANMTEEERRALGLDILSALRDPGSSYLQGGLPSKGGIKATSNISAFGMFSDYPGNVGNAMTPFLPLLELSGVDWKGDKFTRIDPTTGKERDLNEGELAALSVYMMAEGFIPFAGIASKVLAQGRQTRAPLIWYRGDKQFGRLPALRQALIPSPLPGSRTYHPKDQPGRGGGSTGGEPAPAPPSGSTGGGPAGSPF